jgi:hypothetical protein
LQLTTGVKDCAGEAVNVRTSTVAFGATSTELGCGFTFVTTVHVAAFEHPLLRITTWL